MTVMAGGASKAALLSGMEDPIGRAARRRGKRDWALESRPGAVNLVVVRKDRDGL